MIAVADFQAEKELMTVQQVMDKIGARAPSTITRLIKAGRLKAAKMGSMGWLVYTDSVQAFIEDERKKGPAVGFPRGCVRATEPAKGAAKKAKPAKPAKTAKKSARRG